MASAVENQDIAAIFEQVADLLEIQGANPFRIRAYRNAAETIRAEPRPLRALVREGADLSELPDVGSDLAGKIAEIVRTGRLALLDEIGKTTSVELVELLEVPGLGPRRVAALHEALGVVTRADLLREARAGRVREVSGFGERTERAILASLEGADRSRRTLWYDAAPTAEALVAFLEGLAGVRRVVVAGSFRRRRETVGDLDLLVTCRRDEDVCARFTEHPDVERVLAAGDTRASVVLRSGLQVDLRVVPEVSYGAALHYFTGAKAHTIAVRRLALKQGLSVNEYGVWRGDERVAGRSERSVYEAVGLPYVEPELREDRGELEAARRGKLPRLLQPGDVRGDLQVRTGGRGATLESMARAARERGLEYVAVANALPADGGGASLRRHLARLDALQARLRGIRLVRAAEVEILEDGTLGAPAELLEELELVVCAVRAGSGRSRAKQTARLLRALDDPHCHVLARPTGRVLGKEEGHVLDVERLLERAAERGCLLQLDATPDRLDPSDGVCRAARSAGVRIALCSNAERPEELARLEQGVGYARRGWLEASDVANTSSWTELERHLRS